jgi:hypothetical protein
MSTVRPLWLPSKQPMTAGEAAPSADAPRVFARVRVWGSLMFMRTSCGWWVTASKRASVSAPLRAKSRSRALICDNDCFAGMYQQAGRPGQPSEM